MAIHTPPQDIRYLWKLVLAEDEPTAVSSLPARSGPALAGKASCEFRNRILTEGYTRPATLYVEGLNGT